MFHLKNYSTFLMKSGTEFYIKRNWWFHVNSI